MGFNKIKEAAMGEMNRRASAGRVYYPPKSSARMEGDKIPSYKKGGKVKKTGLALVHKGEKVIPKKK